VNPRRSSYATCDGSDSNSLPNTKTNVQQFPGSSSTGPFASRNYAYYSTGGFRGWGYDGMPPMPITCGAQLDDGNLCDEKVTIKKTAYHYDRRPIVGEPAAFTLKETHYHSVCPKCGDRVTVEKHEGLQ
jgi:hypothetical protein